MRIQVVGLQRHELEQTIRQDFPELELVEESPEIVISYGGDGTLLYAERLYPGIPKAALRNSKICHLCSDLSPQEMLTSLGAGRYTVQEYMKIQGEANGVRLLATNDVVVGSPKVNGTVRLNVYANGQKCTDEIVGDGVIVATPIGSSGYYESITRSNFQTGIGVAFNNTVDTLDHLLLADDAVVEIEIVRGPSVFAVDNADEYVDVAEGSRVTVRRASETFAMVRFAGEPSGVIGG